MPPSNPLQDVDAALGIDVSKARLDACLLTPLPGKCRARFGAANSASGIAQLIQWMEGRVGGSIRVVMESTGPYGRLAAELFHHAGHRVSVVNASRIKLFAGAQGRHNKTDEVDAEIIARFGLTQELDPWRPMPAEQAVLRELLHRIDELQDDLQAERNRLEVLPDKKGAVAKDLRQSIAGLSKRMEKLDAAIDSHLQTHPRLLADCQRLEAIPGIGQKSARVLVAELPRDLESSRAAAAWAGVAPRLCQSGTMRKASRIAPGGNRYLRKALYFPAIVARTHNPRFKAFADRLAERGLTKMQVIMAVLHKLLRTAFSILKHQSTYQPTHVSVLFKTKKNPA